MKSIDAKEAVRLCQEAEQMPPAERRKHQEERLRSLVRYAREHSPYFQKQYEGLGDDVSLDQLPPTKKSSLMEDYTKWVTDPQISHDGVLTYIDSPEAGKKLYLGKYTAITTSGTTGNPMPMVRDAYHNAIHGAMMQTRLLRDTDPDLMVPVNHKIASLLFLDPHVSSYSSFLRIKKAYPQHTDNLLAVPIESPIASIAEKLNEFQPDMITGYPSVMGALANAQRDGILRIAPKAIACSAEVLTQNLYQTLKDTFHCPVLNNYCSTEGGEAAMSCGMGKLHINEDWVIIEPVDAEGNPVEEGQWSDGIYITDLTNYVQPVIRYYMEDKVRIQRESCSCGSTLPVMEIMGRVTENLLIGGTEVLGINVEYALQYMEGIYTLQLVQKGAAAFELRMVPESEEKGRAAFEKSKQILQDFFRKNGCPPVEIQMSSEPPIHSKRGGKVKFIVKDFPDSAEEA